MASLRFVNTHNMIPFLSKPTETKGFKQTVDFLNAHPLRYALTVNPTIYVSCIEQFWSTAKAKIVNEDVQLHAKVDGKEIIITESSVRGDLQLADEEGVDYLPNYAIFENLTLMGYEKFSERLTFYKAFFSHQWKFLIHTLLQCLSPKTTAWNEFSSVTESAIICLATNQKFNFSKMIFESMLRNLDNLSGKFLMYPMFVQLFFDKLIDDPANHKRKYITPSHTKKIFRNMKRVGKGFSGIVTPLFPAMVELSQSTSQLGEGRRTRKDTEIPQSSAPTIPPVVDKAVFANVDVKTGGAATIVSNLDAGQGSGNIHKTPSISHDLLPRAEEINVDNVDENVNDVVEDVVREAQVVKDVVEEVVDVISIAKVLVDTSNVSTAEVRVSTGSEEVSTASEKVSTTSEKVSTASEKVRTANDNLSTAYIQVSAATTTPTTSTTTAPTTIAPTTTTTTASTSIAPKQKGVIIQEPSATTTTSSSQQSHQSKDKENFDRAYKRVNTFVDMNTKLVGGSKQSSDEQRADIEHESSKRSREEMEQEQIKKQKSDEDQEQTKLKLLTEINF
ncbi:hypothetical protein Tco_0170005 [Tanacetum coccineum]